MSEDLFTVALFEKIQTSYYPFFGDTIVSLSNDLLAGERKIIEQPNNINADGIILDSISFIGDLDISPKLKKLGKLAPTISWIMTGYDIVNLFTPENILLTAIEDFTCLKYGKYFYTDSREKSEQLYLFAKKELITLYKKRAYSLEYSSFGNVSSYKILNENLMKEFLLKLENFKNKMENNK